MPTGYTYPIEEGDIKTGKEFLLRCSRAFGVAIDLKDEPLDKPTPTNFEPNERYKKYYEQSLKDLERAERMTFAEALSEIRNEYKKNIESAKESLQKYQEIEEKYEKIRKEIEEWNPPTNDHAGIKKFALEQISISSNRWLINSYKKDLSKPIKDSNEDVMEYIKSNIEHCKINVERAKKQMEDDINDAKANTEFMKVFLESLNDLPD